MRSAAIMVRPKFKKRQPPCISALIMCQFTVLDEPHYPWGQVLSVHFFRKLRSCQATTGKSYRSGSHKCKSHLPCRLRKFLIAGMNDRDKLLMKFFSFSESLKFEMKPLYQCFFPLQSIKNALMFLTTTNIFNYQS